MRHTQHCHHGDRIGLLPSAESDSPTPVGGPVVRREPRLFLHESFKRSPLECKPIPESFRQQPRLFLQEKSQASGLEGRPSLLSWHFILPGDPDFLESLHALRSSLAGWWALSEGWLHEGVAGLTHTHSHKRTQTYTHTYTRVHSQADSDSCRTSSFSLKWCDHNVLCWRDYYDYTYTLPRTYIYTLTHWYTYTNVHCY